ncbi:hypothetical protein [Streptomyces millisiae]|uniref:Uncharacterized protein n=1 Tax=Streptomyces millisiae TaxID=3075542 RepID=A0ABU2LMV7_9ACTN|nr:hypothetical protein [Streptomyces sp. DSM 44918]MDT0318830.1 hypothetical protein [Streptomyces sp. DSM 44918]
MLAGLTTMGLFALFLSTVTSVFLAMAVIVAATLVVAFRMRPAPAARPGA